MNKIYSTVSEAINVYRSGGRCYFNIQTDGIEKNNQSLSVVVTKAHNATIMKRKYSAWEKRVKKFQKKGFAVSQLSQKADDDSFLPTANPRTKT